MTHHSSSHPTAKAFSTSCNTSDISTCSSEMYRSSSEVVSNIRSVYMVRPQVVALEFGGAYME